MKISNLKSGKHNFIDSIGYLIIYLMVGFIPHVYKYAQFEPSQSEGFYFKEPMYADLYILAKSKLFLVLTVVLLIVFLFQLFSKRITFIKDRITLGIVIFSFIVLLASLFSPYQDLVYWGAKDRFEGMWVWLAYSTIMIITRHYAVSKKFVEKTLNVFVVSASIMAVFGIMQVLGYDIYTQGPLRWLCFPNEIAADIGNYLLINDTADRAVGAMYNSNYFGVYAALAFLVLVSKVSSVSRKLMIPYLLMLFANYSTMIASKSEASLLSLIVSLFVLALINLEKIKFNKKFWLLFSWIVLVDRLTAWYIVTDQDKSSQILYLTGFFLLIVVALLKYAFMKFNSKFLILMKYKKIISFFVLIACTCGFFIVFKYVPFFKTEYNLNTLVIEKNSVEFDFQNGEYFKVNCDINGISILDKKNNIIIPESAVDDKITFENNGFRYVIKLKYYSNGYLISFTDPFKGINFFYDAEKLSYISPITQFSEIDYPERVNFLYDKGWSLSRRGYLWSTYIPLVKENILIGQGFDIYTVIFPQNDVVGKVNNFYGTSLETIVDKPHSLYIQILLGTGIFGMVLFVLLIQKIIETILESIVLKRDDISGLLSMVVLFLLASIFNDSIIPLMIIMVIVIGCTLTVDE